MERVADERTPRVVGSVLTKGEWRRVVEPVLRAEMAATIDNDPWTLLETWGGPVGMTADLVLVRLLGHDDEIVDDTLIFDTVRPEWLAPIPERATYADFAAAPSHIAPMPRTALYVPLSGYATTSVSFEAMWDGWTPGPHSFHTNAAASILFVRYKRKL